MVSFQAWQKCFDDAGVPQPLCWAEGLLKPHGHTISVSDLAFIGGFHNMVALKVGEIKNYRKDGQGVLMKDGSEMDLDIVIKCTGFHLNNDVPKIVGKSKIHANYLIDYNLTYQAEPILDAGQFGGSKGMADSSDIVDATINQMFERTFMDEKKRNAILPTPRLKDMFVPRGNPFGSGYVGPAAVQADYLAWLSANPGKQKMLLKHMGEAPLDMVQTWSSHLGIGAAEISKKLFVKLAQAKGFDKMEELTNSGDGE
jgi:hypothetical protein